MTQNIKIIDLIYKNIEQVKSYDIYSLALFGSYAKNEESELSDVDIIVNFKKNTFRNYIGLKYFLEDLFGKKVDLVCENSIKPFLKPYILEDAKWLISNGI
ncbi:MAG: nucleotidyltransferase family protein [Ignavibacteriae bacterium]|nr:nucleotidyltransferase family protein [Ignavibacteriota bacterium]